MTAVPAAKEISRKMRKSVAGCGVRSFPHNPEGDRNGEGDGQQGDKTRVEPVLLLPLVQQDLQRGYPNH